MIKEKKKSKIWRGVAGTSVALTAIMGGTIVLSFGLLQTYVNGFFGTSNVKLTNNEDNKDTTYYKSDYNSVTDLVAAREELNKEVARQGTTLLKNMVASDGTTALPFTQSKPKITFLGNQSHQPMYGMCSGAAAIKNTAQITSYEDAFRERGFELNPKTIALYESHKDEYHPNGPGGYGAAAGIYSIGELPVTSEYYTPEIEQSFKDYNDAAVVFIERNIGEGYDLFSDVETKDPNSSWRNYIQNDLEKGTDGVHNALQIQNREWELLNYAKKHFKKVIVFINTSNPIECQDLEEDDGISAVVYVGATGTKGAYGVADVLLGHDEKGNKVSPSGGLVDTWATDNHSAPAMMNYGHFEFANSTDIDAADARSRYGSYYIVEAEGVYIGYKYYETRYEDAILNQNNASGNSGIYESKGNSWNYADEMVYPFGYGLSYTTFNEEIKDVKMVGDELVVDVTVTNTGDYTGMDNVQLYMQSPYTQYDKTNLVEKPFTFIGCAKTENLEKGATTTVTIKVDKELLANYDYKNAECYIREAGDYWFSVGDDAHAAVNNMLAAMGHTNGLVDAKGKTAITNTKAARKFTLAEEKITESNGYKIENHFETADLNSYQPNTVTYLSRQDWVNTYPKSYDGIVAKGSYDGVDMLEELKDKDTYKKDETKTFDFKYGNPDKTDYQLSMMIGNSDWDNEGWDLLLNQMTLADYVAIAFPIVPTSVDGYVAGYNCGFPGNTGAEGPTGNAAGWVDDETAKKFGNHYRMTADEEANEYLKNYNCSSMEQQMLLAGTFNPELARKQGEIFGEDGLWNHRSGKIHCSAQEIGVNNHRTAYSGRNAEYYSEDANLSYILGYEECVGIQSKGGKCEPKHFFGNDQEEHRQGLATFSNEAALREIQMRASEGAIRIDKGGAYQAMTSFSRYGVIQSSCSSAAYDDMIAGEWGNKYCWNITDMAFTRIMPAQEAVANGTDTFCAFSYDSYKTSMNAEVLQDDPYLASRLRNSAKKALYGWANSNDCNDFSSNTKITHVTPWWQPAFISLECIFGVLAAGSIVLYVISTVREKEHN